MARAIMIVEMAGRPAAHVKESLTNHVGILDKHKDIEVHSINVSEPKVIEMENVPKGQEMFTCFAEVDFEVENFSKLSEIVFDFMPSSVEVIEPSKVSLDTGEASNLLNNIAGRMHRYDEIAKVASARLQQMNAQLQAAQEALIEKDKKPAKKKAAKKKAPVKKKKK
jgi:hypothetical protein